MRLLEPDQISHSMDSQNAKTFTVLCCFVKKSFNTQRGRIPCDKAILAAIEHCFIAKKKKTTYSDAWV